MAPGGSDGTARSLTGPARRSPWRSATPEPGSRPPGTSRSRPDVTVCTSSPWTGPLHLLSNNRRRPRTGRDAYRLGQLDGAYEATRRWAADGIVANAVSPGGVATGLQRHFNQKQKDYLAEAEAAGVFAYKTAGQGAAATLVAAVAPEFTRPGGHYLDDGREAYTVPNDAELFGHPHGVKQWAIDPDAAQKLWTISLGLIGVTEPGIS
jgi:hypothetical protein